MTTTPTATTRQYGAVCTAVNRNQKNTGWALKLAARPNMKFEDTFYINDKEPIAEQVQHDLLGQYLTLTLERGNLKDGKTGEYGAWDYWENVRDIKAGEAPAPGPVPTSRDGSQTPERQPALLDQRIAWNSAINNATNLVAASMRLPAEERDEVFQFPGGIETGILGWAAWYYAAIVSGPPQYIPVTVDESLDWQDHDQEAPAAAPGRHAQPPQPPEPPRTPARDPATLVAASAKQWNDDIRSGSRQGKLIGEKFLQSWVYVKYAWDVKHLTPEQAATVAAAIANGEVVGA